MGVIDLCIYDPSVDEGGPSRTAAFKDVQQKAKKIRQSGGVRIVSANNGVVAAEVQGTNNVYNVEINMAYGTNTKTATCSCPWNAYRYERSERFKSLEGRSCAHILATLYEIQAQNMSAGQVSESEGFGVNTYDWRDDRQLVGASLRMAASPGGEEQLQMLIEETEFTHAGVVVKSADSGRVLMTQRTPFHGDDERTYGKWEFPGGGLDEGEDPLTGALREFAEETGMTLPDGWRIDGAFPSGESYLAIVISVPSEAWTTDAALLDLETMGIGWFDVEFVEGGEITRPEVGRADWEMVKEAKMMTEAAVEPFRAKYNGGVVTVYQDNGDGTFETSAGTVRAAELVYTTFDPSAGLTASKTAELKDEPELALADDAQVTGDDPDDARGMTGTVGARIAVKQYTKIEQQVIVGERPVGGPMSRNADRLILDGTHYDPDDLLA